MDHLIPKKNVLLRPLFKWAGGKRWFMKRYAKVFTAFCDYRVVEPFAGGLAFSFYVNPKKVLANDINHHLINVYQQIKDKNFEIPPIQLSPTFYESIRTEFNSLIQKGNVHTFRAAQLFWLLNRLGFNGLCRFNREGYFNTPYGQYTKIFDNFEWKNYTNLFKCWEFTSGSFENLKLGRKDFLFCDPPYDDASPVYSKELFNFDDQIKLASWVAKHKHPAILMNHATPRIMELYQSYGFELSTILAPRTLSADASTRKPRLELIASYNFSWKELSKKI